MIYVDEISCTQQEYHMCIVFTILVILKDEFIIVVGINSIAL